MSKVKRLNVSTTQGFSGELSKGSQFSFAYETADATREVSLVMPYDALGEQRAASDLRYECA
ncbi:hypothetical protein [Pseudomonas sp. SDO52101_S400]